jgi:hypothetical protein
MVASFIGWKTVRRVLEKYRPGALTLSSAPIADLPRGHAALPDRLAVPTFLPPTIHSPSKAIKNLSVHRSLRIFGCLFDLPTQRFIQAQTQANGIGQISVSHL